MATSNSKISKLFIICGLLFCIALGFIGTVFHPPIKFEYLLFNPATHDLMDFSSMINPRKLVSKNLSEEQSLLVKAGKKRFAELHKLDPNNKKYMAMYAACQNFSYGNYYNFLSKQNYKEVMASKADKAKFMTQQQNILKIIAEGEKLDPQNGLYNFLRARILLNEAIVKITHKKVAKENKTKVFEDVNYEVINAKKLNEAMAEVFKGVKKPFCETYTFELAQQKSDILFGKDTKGYNSRLSRMITEAGTLLPHLGTFRNITRGVKTAIIYNYKQRNYSECEKLINTWKPFSTKFSETDPTLISYLLTIAIDKIYFNTAKQFYTARNDKKMAAKFAQKAQYLEEQREKFSHSYADKRIKKYQGIATSMFTIPNTLILSEDELIKAFYPENIASYKAVEIGFITYFSFLLAIILLIYTICVAAAKNDAKFLPLTTFEKLRLPMTGFVFPLTIYLVITNIDCLSNRVLGIAYHKSIIVSQLILLVYSLFVMLSIAVCCTVRNHCKKDNIPVPSDGFFRYGTGLLYWLLVAATIFIEKSLLAFVVVLTLNIFMIFAWAVWSIAIEGNFGQFFRLLNKNLLLYWAIFPVLTLITLFIVLNYQQDYFANKDKFIFQENQNLFSNAEGKLVKLLKKNIKENILEEK